MGGGQGTVGWSFSNLIGDFDNMQILFQWAKGGPAALQAQAPRLYWGMQRIFTRRAGDLELTHTKGGDLAFNPAAPKVTSF